jgi:UDP-N-acetylglucosamine 2-epimerase (non-hydrolysing)
MYALFVQHIMYRSESFYDDVASRPEKHVHIILIATKPDIIKQVPLYKELMKRGHLVLLGHTGQHYDENLSGGMLKEFGVIPDFNLNVRGSMHEVVSQIIGRLGHIIGELKAQGKIVIPYVHGDTTTAMAASNAGFCHGFASVHVEAGIRTLTPKYRDFTGVSEGDFDVGHWFNFLQKPEHWERGSLEPYPEQFNTRAAEAATGLHLAPHDLDRDFLESEGYPSDRIVVVGNSVADATMEALENASVSEIFETYPALEQGNFVRFCIHRRENCMSEGRFRAIYDAMVSLILDGKTVLLITLYQTEEALKRYGLKDEIDTLAKDYKNFIYSPVWPQYTDVIAAMSKAAVCATDSGSMQEEMNILGVPCVTLRFGSDRSESIMNGGNIIAPPVDGTLVRKIIDFAWGNEYMKRRPKIYGEDVSKKCIDEVVKVLDAGEMFRTEEDRLHLR